MFLQVGAVSIGGLAVASWAQQRLQRRLVFGRPKVLRRLPEGPHAGAVQRTAWRLPVARGVTLQGWSARPRDEQSIRGALIYFAGRNEDVAWAPDIASYLDGWSVHAFAYRGVGGSGGMPGEREVVQDALRIHAAVLRREGAVAGAGAGSRAPRIAIMGRSLGSGVAVQLAARVAPERLVLLSPFDSIPALLAGHPLLRAGAPLLRHRFESIRHAPAITCPTLVLLAENDARVPHANSRRLAQQLRGPTELCQVDGTNHQSLPRSLGAQVILRRFLAAATKGPA